MAGAFSGHLVDSYNANQPRHSTPFRVSTSDSPIVTSGSLSFNPQMHGHVASNFGNQSLVDTFSVKSEPPSFFESGLSDSTTHKIAALQAKLNQKLGPEYISQRPGPGGGPKLTYAEGWKIINLANEVFGFNGWSSSVVSLTMDYIDFNEETKRYNVGATAIMRVTLRDGVFHEDIGYGLLENSKSKGQALDKCKKEAVTDGLKRTLRNFGNLLGNCLYDKSYAQEIVKIKVPPAKFDKSELHRRPEFEEKKPNTASVPTTSSSTLDPPPDMKPNIVMTPMRPNAQPRPQPRVLSSVPVHIRSEITPGAPSSHQNNSHTIHDTTTPMTKGKAAAAAVNTGLNTPITTPAHASTSRQTPQTTPPERERERKVSFARPTTTAAHTASTTNTTTNRTTVSSTAVTGRPSPPAPVPAPAPLPENPNQETADPDPDESYHFYSDDDAFLALVDLGEGDLGQPVLEEADLGRPIDEGGEETSICWEGSGGEESSVGDAGRNGGGGGGRRHDVLEQGTTAAAAGGPSRLEILSRVLPLNQPGPNNSSSSSRHAPHNTDYQPPQNDPQHRQQQQPHRQPNTNAPQNENRPPAQMGQRPATPSMGGFHFPPGVSRLPPPGNNKPSGSGIGLKRPLDSMSNLGMGGGQRRPGMGLNIHGGSDAGQVKREVFGQLDVGESGDVKRVRR